VSHAAVVSAITPDGTLGTTVNQAGNVFDINGGTIKGSNQFHSFDRFNVGTGDIASFNGPNGIVNILSRVTGLQSGLQQSMIDGTLRSTIAGANLFLLNPAGVLFGPNASLDVSGSIHVSSADYIRMFDGASSAYFYANPASDGVANSVLSAAPVVDFGFLTPAAFGFTNANPASITVQGSLLSVPEGQTMSFVGGNITIQAGTLEDSSTQAATLSAPGGRINLASVASAGEVLYPSLQFGPNVNGDSFNALGSISLSQGATLDVSGSGILGSGAVVIRGGQLMVDQSSILANTGDADGANPGIDINVWQDVTLTNGAMITSSTSGVGRGGDMQVTAGTATLDGASTITTQTDGDGNAGNISANVGNLSLTGGAMILSNNNINFTFGFGQGGNVTIQGLQGAGSAADSITLTGGAAITTQTFGPERAGDVAITTGSLMLDGSMITTQTFGPGRGGDVSITAGALQLDNFASINSFTFFGDGVGGDLSLNVGTLTLTGGSTIQSQSFNFTPGLGQGGNITIQGMQADSAADSVALSGGSFVSSQTLGSGDGGRIVLSASTLTMADGGTAISAFTAGGEGAGSGGEVVVNVQDLSLSGGANITSQAGVGAGGNVTVQGLNGPESAAGLVTISGQGSGIFSDALGAARPGNITMHVGTLTLTDGAMIRAGTPFNTSAGSDVTITATDSVVISSGGTIQSQSFNEDAGQVHLQSPSVTMDNGFINTSTFSTGLGGDVVLDVVHLSLMGGARIDSGTTGSGQGGTVTIQGFGGNGTAADTVTIAGQDGAGQASGVFTNTGTASVIINRFAEGFGGDISVKTKALTLLEGGTISAASTSLGDAGSITITTTGNTLSLASGSTITSSTTSSGDAGQILITSPVLSLDNATITTSTSASGNAGSIIANVGTAILTANAEISSSSTGAATGNAGSVTIQGLASPANSVTLTNSSLRTSAANTGRGGSITVDATSVTLDSATISASVKDFNAADPADSAAVGTGNVALTASTITMTGGTVTAETSGTRDAGTVTVTTTGNTLTVGGGGTITSSTTSSGDAGQILITSPVLSLNNATITTSTSDTGNAGSITANVGTATLTANAEISSSSTGAATGNAGSVTIQGLASPAQTVTLTGSKVLTSTDGSGAGGAITMDAGTINLTNATVSAASTGAGNSGTLTLTAGNTFQSDNSSVKTSAVLGQGGGISLTAGQVQLGNKTVISAESSGPGNAGDITVNALHALALNNSTITTKAALGDGGNITLLGKGSDLFYLINSEISSSVGNPEKTTTVGGNINIDPDFVILKDSQILANAFAGTGGNITIEAAKAVLADPSSVIDASSKLGVSGTVDIQAPVTNLSEAIAPLSGTFLRAAVLLQARCAAQLSGNVSSLVLAGRDAIPLEPGSLLPSPLYFGGGAVAPLAGTGETVQNAPASRSGLVGIDEQVIRIRQAWQSIDTPMAPELGCGS
jgi:filamentous hemagglutinin family protein